MSVIKALSADESFRYMEYEFWCPGCKEHHSFRVLKPGAQPYIRQGGKEIPKWTFNGNLDSPTFQPSLLYNRPKRCHLHVEGGHIRYEPDCSHELKGKTVPMERLK